MSHAATKWAFDQPEQHPDMKPGELVVLAVLADCHNPLHGCYPSHDYIAVRTNLSERSVRDQLARLRERGLIDWDGAREAGRRGSNRYRLACEADFLPANSAGRGNDYDEPHEELPANLAGSPDEGALPANCDTSTGKSRQFYRQILPPHIEEPVKEPVKEPLRESAGEREDRKIVERWLKRTHPNWPSYVSDSAPKALAAALALSGDERDAGAARMGDYLAQAKVGGRTVVCTFAVYLAEKRWEKLPPPAEAPFNEFATPFSKPWSAWILGHLLTAEGEAAKGWPLVEVLYRKAKIRQGHKFGKRWHDLGAGFVAVPVGSEAAAAWRAEFERRGWPWMPDPGSLPVIHLPPGGPAGLEAYEAATAASEQAA